MKKTVKTKGVDEAIKSLQKPTINIEEINRALNSKNYNELIGFMFEFSGTKECQKLLQVLARIQDNPQQLCGDDEFSTIITAAKIDGERALVRKFVNLMSMALDQDREGLENVINRNHLA